MIKVSGACTLSREPYPFPDIWDPLARVFDAWGFVELAAPAWLRGLDLNQRPLGYEPNELPGCSTPR